MRVRRLISKTLRAALGGSRYMTLRRASLNLRSNRRAFTEIYERCGWLCSETVSGRGSTLAYSERMRSALPQLLRALGAESILDAGCGDFNWMRTVDLSGVRYTGVDVVPALIRRNQELYGDGTRQFLVADITRDRLPRAEVVLCRHCLIHLSNRQVLAAIRNFSRCHCKYLVATTLPGIAVNTDTWRGGFRPINLEAAPFNLPPPLETIEDTPDGDRSAVLGVWRLDAVVTRQARNP